MSGVEFLDFVLTEILRGLLETGALDEAQFRMIVAELRVGVAGMDESDADALAERLSPVFRRADVGVMNLN